MKICISKEPSSITPAESAKLTKRILEINKILLDSRKASGKDRLTVSEYNRYMGELKQINLKFNPNGSKMRKPMSKYD